MIFEKCAIILKKSLVAPPHHASKGGDRPTLVFRLRPPFPPNSPDQQKTEPVWVRFFYVSIG